MSFFANKLQPVSLDSPGESGYFSSPGTTLDPRLFGDSNGERIRSEVRNWLLNTLYGFWGPRYNAPREWSRAWIAGSGLSYQWQASRGNGDLDILIGVEFGKFFAANPRFRGSTPEDMASIFNQEFHDELWPKTAVTNLNPTGIPTLNGTDNVFETTWYVNPQSADIRGINPYAAYNLSTDSWTVRPPSGTDFDHPKEYYTAAEREADLARSLAHKFNQSVGKPSASLVAAQAVTLYDDIHHGRQQAFAGGGSGYGDYYNFRWQYHKQQGTAQLLNAIARQYKASLEASDASVYGRPIDSAETSLRRSALWNRGGNGRVYQ